jgi:hypothetical protein
LNKTFWVFATIAAMGIGTTAVAADSLKPAHKPVQKKSHVSHTTHSAKASTTSHNQKPSTTAKKMTSHKPAAHNTTTHKTTAPKPAAKTSSSKSSAKPMSRLDRRHA